MKNWPRLSESLPHAAPEVCGHCGRDAANCTSDIQLWQEFDDSDRREQIWFWLCEDCSKKIVVPHPRLYECVCDNTPAPGAMQICSDCPHRVRTRCKCPDARMNGGPKIVVNACEPLVMHVNRGRKGGSWHRSFALPPTGCTGKTPELKALA